MPLCPSFNRYPAFPTSPPHPATHRLMLVLVRVEMAARARTAVGSAPAIPRRLVAIGLFRLIFSLRMRSRLDLFHEYLRQRDGGQIIG